LGETIYYRRVIATWEEPYQWQNKQTRVDVQRLPKRHWNVFHREKQSPREKGNRRISSRHNDLREINCKIYPLSKEEEGHVQQFLREEQNRGYIGRKTAPAFTKDKRERRLILGYKRINRYVIRDNKEMTSIHHTPESLLSPFGKRLPSKLPAEEPENTNAKRKGKQKAIPEIHTSPPSELPLSSEISERRLWPSAPSTSSYLEKASWRHLNSIPDRAEGSAVAGGSEQNRQDDHKTPSSTRELPEPLGLREHQPETSMSKQLPKEENTEDSGAKIAKTMEQPKKLSNISGSRSASRATGRRNSLIQGLRNIIEPLTKLGKGKMTFRKTQRLACVPEQMDDNISEKPGAICPDLKKPPETETGATIRAKPLIEDRKAQAEAIGSQSKRHLPEDPPHETATQANCNPQEDNGGTVKCGSTSERRRGKHSLSIKSHAMSPPRR
jgi:hypothetical protein